MRLGPTTQNIVGSDLSTTIAVASTATVYTKAFPMTYGANFAIGAIATSSGNVALKIELECSYQLPTTEGAADGTYVEPDGMADVFSSIADEVQHYKQLYPIPMPFARFKITGGAGNDASTTVQIKLFEQQEM